MIDFSTVASQTVTTMCESETSPSWFISIMKGDEEEENNKPQQPSNPRVPEKLIVEENKACYIPLVVSIGPHHHHSGRETELSAMKKLKARMTRDFLCNLGEEKWKNSYEDVKQVLQAAKGFYTDELMQQFTDEEFAEMIIIDGCFVLQFIRRYMEHENLEMTGQLFARVKRDLFLLENQLPFLVLESLMKLGDYRGRKHIDSFLYLSIPQASPEIPVWKWILVVTVGLFIFLLMLALLPLTCLLCCFYREKFLGRIDEPLDELTFPTPSNEEEEEEKVSAAHLLELLRSKFIPRKSKQSGRSGRNHVGNYLYYSAKNLKRVGVYFRPSEAGALTDIKFESSFFSGTLKIRPIIIDESTKALLLNLVASETSAGLDQLWVTSYICFMASLIKDAEDVEELRSKGIIVNDLGSDQEVVKLFSEMAKNLTPDPHAYNDVTKDINKQCKSVRKRWTAECWQKYFSSPWAFIAFVAAALGLILTGISTYKTVFPPKRS